MIFGHLWGDTRVLYTVLVGLAAVERLCELRIASRNRQRLLKQGAVEVGAGHYPWMVLLHTLWLLACPLEVWLLGRPFLPVLAAVALAGFLGSMALRYWVIATLGGRWTTRILVLPGSAPIAAGPYRFTRHPNYLAVIVEIATLPLVHTAWWTAIVWSLADALLLRVRIRAEEKALSEVSSYGSVFAGRPRFLPGGGRTPR
ncbi:MAG: methyltransferase [Acidobacteriota bacterium]|jgi:methyltransferase|nr:methyltransferase [Acidobacteriota bacterium]